MNVLSVRLKQATSTLALCGALAVPTPVFAQNAEEAEADRAEIIVTAQRREERLQDVPIAISAVTAEDFEQRGARRLQPRRADAVQKRCGSVPAAPRPTRRAGPWPRRSTAVRGAPALG